MELVACNLLKFSNDERLLLGQSHRVFSLQWFQGALQFKEVRGEYECPFEKVDFEQYIAAIPEEADIEIQDTYTICTIADYYGDVEIVNKIYKLVADHFGFEGLKEGIDSPEMDECLKEFYTKAYFQRVLEQPTEEWERLLKEIKLDSELTLTALLEGLANDDASKALQKLQQYFLSQKNPFSQLAKDFSLMARLTQGKSPEFVETLSKGLLDLCQTAIELQVGAMELGRIVDETVFERLNRTFTENGLRSCIEELISCIQEKFPPRPFRDTIRAWTVLKNMNRYQSMSKAILNNAKDKGVSEDTLNSLKNRVNHIQLRLKYPWSANSVAAEIATHRSSCSKQLVTGTVFAVSSVAFTVLVGMSDTPLVVLIEVTHLMNSQIFNNPLLATMRSVSYLCFWAQLAFKFSTKIGSSIGELILQMIRTGGTTAFYAIPLVIGIAFFYLEYMDTERDNEEFIDPNNSSFERRFDQFSTWVAPKLDHLLQKIHAIA